MAPQGSAARGAGLTPATTASRVGRDGALALRFERRGDRSVLAGCRWRLPLQVLAPLALDDAAAIVSILNPTGGLVGGDRLVVDVAVGAGAPGPGLGSAEGRPYVATVAVIADAGLAAFVDDVTALGGDDAEVGAGLLPRRGALVRCLAADAPAMARTLDGVWAAARRLVLGRPPLALRKPCAGADDRW